MKKRARISLTGVESRESSRLYESTKGEGGVVGRGVRTDLEVHQRQKQSSTLPLEERKSETGRGGVSRRGRVEKNVRAREGVQSAVGRARPLRHGRGTSEKDAENREGR